MRKALQELVNVTTDILAAYADVIGTESEPGWIYDLQEATKQAQDELAPGRARE